MRKKCSEPGCRNTGTGPRCAQHTRTRERGRATRQPYRAGYQTQAYRRARQAAIANAGGRCTRITAGRRCTKPATEVHHITPLSVDPTRYADPTNLAPVCRPHNPRGGAR